MGCWRRNLMPSMRCARTISQQILSARLGSRLSSRARLTLLSIPPIFFLMFLSPLGERRGEGVSMCEDVLRKPPLPTSPPRGRGVRAILSARGDAMLTFRRLLVVAAFVLPSWAEAQVQAQTSPVRPDQVAFRALYKELVET